MATFFGEILPVFSRAVDDSEDEAVLEEDEEDQEIRRELAKKRREVYVEWNPEISSSTKNSSEGRLQCSNFILAVGDNAVGFLQCYILSSGNWEEVGSVHVWNERCKDLTATNQKLPANSSCVLYQLSTDPTVLACQCGCYVAEDQLFQWTEKIFNSIQTKGVTVTVLSSWPVAEYRTAAPVTSLQVPFLQALKTRDYSGTICCPLLTQPNVVQGLPAAVLSHCQVWQIPAVLYQCYTDTIKLDLVTVEAFRPVVSSKNLSPLVQPFPTKECFCSLGRRNKKGRNLYK
uniref:Proteasome assembly chaperone 1 n=1 Tax=Latimeria chalumnae TaxID=7897 RepID=H3AU04_LATCH